ncbi:MAG: hypothetical protein ACPHUE_03810, partial [Flavobacteriaceae bacterium]
KTQNTMKKFGLTILSIMFVGFLVGGILSGLFYENAQAQMASNFPAAVKLAPDISFMLINIFAMALFTTLCFDKMGIRSAKEGAMTGWWFMGLFFVVFHAQELAVMNIITIEFATIDVLLSALMGLVLGAVCGESLRRFS